MTWSITPSASALGDPYGFTVLGVKATALRAPTTPAALTPTKPSSPPAMRSPDHARMLAIAMAALS